jgi:hypothetical protein
VFYDAKEWFMSINFDTPDNDEERPDWMTDAPIYVEEEDTAESVSRLFVIIAVALAGLIFLGLVAVGGLLLIRRTQNQQQLAQLTPAPVTVIEEVIPTATFTPTPIPVTPTESPTITPTNTPVVRTPSGEAAGSTEDGDGGQDGAAGGAGQGATATPTRTPAPAATTPANGQVPNTGFGGFEAGLVAIALVAVLFITRRLRHAG